MELSKAQSAAFEKVRARGAGDQGIALADGSIRALIGLVARDLALPPIEGIDPLGDEEFYEIPPSRLSVGGEASALNAYRSLLQVGPVDTDTYFLSLAVVDIEVGSTMG